MKFDSRWKPVAVNLVDATDEELVDYQLHPNDWFVRIAARLLQERSSEKNADTCCNSAAGDDGDDA